MSEQDKDKRGSGIDMLRFEDGDQIVVTGQHNGRRVYKATAFGSSVMRELVRDVGDPEPEMVVVANGLARVADRYWSAFAAEVCKSDDDGRNGILDAAYAAEFIASVAMAMAEELDRRRRAHGEAIADDEQNKLAWLRDLGEKCGEHYGAHLRNPAESNRIGDVIETRHGVRFAVVPSKGVTEPADLSLVEMAMSGGRGIVS